MSAQRIQSIPFNFHLGIWISARALCISYIFEVYLSLYMSSLSPPPSGPSTSRSVLSPFFFSIYSRRRRRTPRTGTVATISSSELSLSLSLSSRAGASSRSHRCQLYLTALSTPHVNNAKQWFLIEFQKIIDVIPSISCISLCIWVLLDPPSSFTLVGSSLLFVVTFQLIRHFPFLSNTQDLCIFVIKVEERPKQHTFWKHPRRSTRITGVAESS